MSEQEKAKVADMVKKISALPEAGQQRLFAQADLAGFLLERYDFVPKSTDNADQGTDKSG